MTDINGAIHESDGSSHLRVQNRLLLSNSILASVEKTEAKRDQSRSCAAGMKDFVTLI